MMRIHRKERRISILEEEDEKPQKTILQDIYDDFVPYAYQWGIMLSFVIIWLGKYHDISQLAKT
jgi:hypothetical protein